MLSTETLEFPSFETERKVSIKTLSGEMLFEQKIPKNKSFTWNGVKYDNNFIEPGSYIYLIEQENGERQLGVFSIAK